MSLNDKNSEKTSSDKSSGVTRSGGTRSKPAEGLLAAAPRVVNVGVPGFAEELAAQGVSVVQLDWRPPAGGARLAQILSIVGS